MSEKMPEHDLGIRPYLQSFYPALFCGLDPACAGWLRRQQRIQQADDDPLICSIQDLDLVAEYRMRTGLSSSVMLFQTESVGSSSWVYTEDRRPRRKFWEIRKLRVQFSEDCSPASLEEFGVHNGGEWVPLRGYRCVRGEDPADLEDDDEAEKGVPGEGSLEAEVGRSQHAELNPPYEDASTSTPPQHQ